MLRDVPVPVPGAGTGRRPRAVRRLRGGGPARDLRRDVRRAASPGRRSRASRSCSRRCPPDELARAQVLAETALLNQGVTFSVYGDTRGTEKIFPFCLVPRLIAAADFAPARARPAAAAARARRVPRRHLRRAEDPRGRRRARRDGARRRGLPPDAARDQAARRRADPHRGHRSDPRSGGHVARARGQPAHAVGRVVRGREPR